MRPLFTERRASEDQLPDSELHLSTRQNAATGFGGLASVFTVGGLPAEMSDSCWFKNRGSFSPITRSHFRLGRHRW